MNRRFIQREISWNAFNGRVLYEGLRKDIALLDRLKYMAIASSNYDEFFRVRVGRLVRDKKSGDYPFGQEGERPSQVLEELLIAVRAYVEQQDMAISTDILPAMAKEGIVILFPGNWGAKEQASANRIFEQEIFSACTPIALKENNEVIDHAGQERICVAFAFSSGKLAIVRVPENIKRFQNLLVSPQRHEMMLAEDIILACGEQFFPGYTIVSRCLFRITRDADMSVDEERDEDFIAAMEEVLESRKSSFPVRLESSGDADLANTIRETIGISAESHFHLTSPLGLKSFMTLASLPDFAHLRSELPLPQTPIEVGDNNLWDTLKSRDILIHHPYESYTPILRMLDEASTDSSTLAIKMTLYRTSRDSPIVKALVNASERGIQVTVLVEIKARFDEDTNIHWVTKLKKAGAIVVYGLAELKVHAKALMIVRREENKIQRYLHLSTGNYNEITAQLYTDMSLLTAREEFTRDATLIFNAITGYTSEPQLHSLFMAPFSLRKKTLQLIHRETEQAKHGGVARILAKMNALVDEEIIEALYEASSAGVEILLNVRGICCLRPKIMGMSENIRVVSIVDRFLEHTRAFAYHNGGNNMVFLSSADWMSRNMDRRIELLFPVLETPHKRRVMQVLESCFKDNVRAWELQSDGTWERRKEEKREKPFRMQEFFSKMTMRIAEGERQSHQNTITVRRKSPAVG